MQRPPKKIVENGAMPVVFGGEHTVTYGVVKGLREAGYDNFGIVQIDAHADLREAYEGDPLSHASVMKRAVDMGIPLYQLGIRAYCEEEMQIREQHGVYFQDGDELVPQNIQSIELPEDFPEQGFLHPGHRRHGPVRIPIHRYAGPGGLGWYQTLNLFESVAKQRKIIGFDIMEFAPIRRLPRL